VARSLSSERSCVSRCAIAGSSNVILLLQKVGDVEIIVAGFWLSWRMHTFRITDTSAPRRLNSYQAIDFRFTTAMHKTPHHGTMFSFTPECSQLLLMDATGTAYMLVSYSVRAYVPRMTWAFEGGHTLLVTGSYLRCPGELELMLTRRLVTRESVHNSIQRHRSVWEDRNLKIYRHLVLRF
jgi:hypothetical protein